MPFRLAHRINIELNGLLEDLYVYSSVSQRTAMASNLITISSASQKDHRNKKLLTKGTATRSKDATRGSWPYY